MSEEVSSASKSRLLLGRYKFPVFLFKSTWSFVCLCIIGLSFYEAFQLRMESVRRYGYVIHEFDPWFNYRATEYLDQHGWNAFFHWYDYMSWYPLGRSVGTTIYPGMQLTAVFMKRLFHLVGINMSLNKICVLIPGWFAVIATIFLGGIAYEVSSSITVMAVACYTFSIIPAHTMRSMTGEFDNECIAMSAMLITFYFWLRSLRNKRSWPIGVLAGLAYGYMVAVWGGHIFVLNMVALHACACALMDWLSNTYNPSLTKSYSLFFIIGTAIAVCVPPVGMSPFKSLEQISALLTFVGLCSLQISEYFRLRWKYDVRTMATFKLRLQIIFFTFSVILAVLLMMIPSHFFGPLSFRVRALFVAHTQTGNPLVDSVAEHQPMSSQGFRMYLHTCYLGWALGFLLLLNTIWFMPTHNKPAALFAILYSCTAYYFSTRMSRLMIFAGPVATICSSYVVGFILNNFFESLQWPAHNVSEDTLNVTETQKSNANGTTVSAEESKVNKNRKLRKKGRKEISKASE